MEPVRVKRLEPDFEKAKVPAPLVIVPPKLEVPDATLTFSECRPAVELVNTPLPFDSGPTFSPLPLTLTVPLLLTV